MKELWIVNKTMIIIMFIVTSSLQLSQLLKNIHGRNITQVYYNNCKNINI